MKRNPDAYRKSSRSKKKAEAVEKERNLTSVAEKEIWAKIEALDLSSVRDKLTSRKSWWWNFWANLDKIEAEYRQFLFLIATNPGETVVPWSQDLDDFWHEHILDTAKYTSECQAIFGKYIHHNPHLPAGTPEQQLAFSKTKDMYRKAFGDRAKNKNSSSADCGAGCTAAMPVVFCATPACASPGGMFGISSGISSSPSCSSAAPSCSTPSCSSSSCSSSSCGGGGGCGGGGD